jgi:PAS domain S-box-containing protein
VMELTHYRLEALHQDGEFILYRGLCKANSKTTPQSILALAPILERPAPATLKKMEHEFSLKDELDPAWAIRPIALTQDESRAMLLFEDADGEPLDRLLGRPFELKQFLRCGIGLAAALGQAHRRGLIHKDIKPSNVFVNAAVDRAWLTGFGIASRLPRERQAAEPPGFISGTLAYMAPEQTGRMNRSIDSRSDLYALGITLYELLTGSLPFTATDPMEWVHCHIARQPRAPAEQLRDIPRSVSAIIMKLLAKTPEERYQTAAGLESDLRRCLGDWDRERDIHDFPLGERDKPDRFLIPETLYGREGEIETLLASFDRVVKSGTPELVLVSGFSGIGKSSVVHELHKVLVQPRGLYASGKFDQYKRDIPYVTLAQAFQSLVRSLLSQGEVELGRWRDSFSEALGSNAQLIVNLVPELELIIGKQPSVPDLPPQEAKNRFQMVFRRFLGVFAHKEHPLALFLDDLQWLDSATLDLLEHLITHPEVRHLLLVGAYRDNEVGPSHPLMRTLEAIRDTDAKVYEIVLAPLGLGDVARLIADALHCAPERARTLAQLVEEKTGGNPFFAIQFLIALADEGLLAFESVAAVWAWDINRIHAKNYTDNVVDLMVQKLKRLSITTQDALKYLGCLGNMAEIGTLSMVYQQTEEAMHAALWEAVRAGLIVHQGNNYKFLHDRIQQAAYSLFPEMRRAAVHLRIGRQLLANMTAEELTEQLFEVANQFNRGGTLIVDRDEKAQVATINLRAGRKAKVSAAYASACAYLASGMALLDERAWSSHYELMFSLWLECAQCELQIGNFEKAEQLIGELLARAASKVDQAAVYTLKVRLHTVKGEYPQAVDNALTCLRLFGVDLPAHPSWEEVQAEYETIWRNLNGRSIECLIDLPLMIDPQMQAAMQVFSSLSEVGYFTDFYLYCMLVCRMANISMQHGMSGPSAHAYACLGSILGPVFHRYHEGYRLGRLACDLVEKHDFTAYRTKAYHDMGLVGLWTQPITSVIELRRATTRTATETGDLTFACYSMHQSITALLLRNDPLDAVRRESEMALDFARTARFRDVADLILGQQRFIATMQGRTATFSTFSDVQFDEARFEAQLTGDRMNTMICLYWILKLKARFLSGDYAEALAAADKAKPVLSSEAIQIYLLDYSYYTALTVAALYDNASADEQAGWRNLLTAHREQLREWAENYPPTFGDKHALVSGEIARLEGRDADAMRLYEQAIRSAREHGFVQNEGLAHEVAAGFYAARGVESIAYTYLRNARDCYLRWGALGKVRQLDQRHSGLREESAPSAPSATLSTPVEQLDVGTVLKASQAVSSEIELGKLIETLMRIAVEHAGAERGLLVLPQGTELRVQAEAVTAGGSVAVNLCDAPITSGQLPVTVLQYAARSQESVILEDASARGNFSDDEYILEKRTRSILCLPLVKQGRLIAILYLENNLAANVFSPRRIAVLNVLASSAAISLENSRLYRGLQEREAKIRRLVDANIVGIFIWDLDGRLLEANDAFLHIVGYGREDLASGRMRWTDLTPPEWLELDLRQQVPELKATGSVQPFEKEFFRKDGSRVPVLMGVARIEEAGNQGVAFVLDLSERKHAEQARDRLHQLEADLAHLNRVSMLGELAAALAHELKQPIAAVAVNADACALCLRRDPPDLERAANAAETVIAASQHAGEIIDRVRSLYRRETPEREQVDLNEIVLEMIAMLRDKAMKYSVSIHTELDPALPTAVADRVQIQQVLMNLLLNGIEAMQETGGGKLTVASTKTEDRQLLVTVSDSGVGISADHAERLFEAFFTTKPEGTGMGLSISQRIIESHGGLLWANPNPGRGATFGFALPAEERQDSACRSSDARAAHRSGADNRQSPLRPNPAS